MCKASIFYKNISVINKIKARVLEGKSNFIMVFLKTRLKVNISYYGGKHKESYESKLCSSSNSNYSNKKFVNWTPLLCHNYLYTKNSKM